MLSPDQVSSRIEQIMDRSLNSDKSLRLSHRFELLHPSFPLAGRLSGNGFSSALVREIALGNRLGIFVLLPPAPQEFPD